MALNFEHQQTYTKVGVSDKAPGFENGYADVHPAFLNDWLQRFVAAIRLLDPEFPDAELKLPLKFQSEWIDSDGPYGSSENFYQLRYFYLVLSEGTPREIRISFEEGRHDGGEPICLDAIGSSLRASSCIHRPDPTATFHLWHEPARRPEFEALLNPSPAS